jgi:proteic killer suppression protein
MIISFRDRITEVVFRGTAPKGFPSDLLSVTRRKLRYLNAATELGDLKAPPGNHLEALKADRAGHYSIGSTTSFEFVLSGPRTDRKMSNSQTTTD